MARARDPGNWKAVDFFACFLMTLWACNSRPITLRIAMPCPRWLRAVFRPPHYDGNDTAEAPYGQRLRRLQYGLLSPSHPVPFPFTFPLQTGLVAMIGLLPVALDGRTWVKLLPCHWKMKAAAAPFSPSASNFTGPCTLFSVTPLCR